MFKIVKLKKYSFMHEPKIHIVQKNLQDKVENNFAFESKLVYNIS